jgi:sulfite exporter TauE/SafE/copper chaperone CopZ
MTLHTQTLDIDGMHCQGCEQVIEQAVGKLPGVRTAKADYAAGRLTVCFDGRRIAPARIAAAIEAAGYACSPRRPRISPLHTLGRIATVLLALAAMAGLIVAGETLGHRLHLPRLEQGMSHGLLFLVGLITGLHCIGMCGGFVVGYTTRAAARGGRTPVLPHLAYGLGKTLSYTVIGGLFGLLGAAIAFTPEIRGYAAIAAGLFLVLFGLNMLDWFPWLRRVSLPMPRAFSRLVGGGTRKTRSPFLIGLLNGLMIACGPLQAMYVMAAGTGSFTEGAKLLFIFGLGTLPVMLGFGLLAGVVSGRLTRGLLKASALLVVALGLVMLNRGLILAGSGHDFRSLAHLAASRFETFREDLARITAGGRQEIRMAVTAHGYEPARFVLKQGVPVRWLIEGRELNYCNHRIVVPALGLEFDVKPGENLIEFTPTQAGVIPWSCWMGMIHGSFVVEPADSAPP